MKIIMICRHQATLVTVALRGIYYIRPRRVYEAPPRKYANSRGTGTPTIESSRVPITTFEGVAL